MTTPSVITRTINRYARAVEAKAFEGTIPYFSQDREEQELLDAHHEHINRELERSEAALRRLIPTYDTGPL